jgi:serpin B
VSDTTRGLIPAIVDADSVANRVLLLVNTVYLKASWRVPFVLDDTSDSPGFTTVDGSEVEARFMRDHSPGSRRFVRLADADAVEIPYEGDELAMWIIVPHAVDGLADLEARLDAASITALADTAAEGLVHLTLPGWEYTLAPTDLFAWLCPLGLCPGAAFDDIAPGVFIDAAVHSARVIVDENGTEAAAVTALEFAESGSPDADLTLVADRPFLWVIVHQDTGALLFVGRVTEPT